MQNTQTKENKMGVMPVPRLLITMSLPMMLSMLVQALYNIVDSIFVAQINENALTAVSLAFPIQSLMIAISAGTGVGINALLSRNLGGEKVRGREPGRQKRNLSRPCQLRAHGPHRPHLLPQLFPAADPG